MIAWSREADLALGEYGEPVELYRHGEVPDMEWLFRNEFVEQFVGLPARGEQQP